MIRVGDKCRLVSHPDVEVHVVADNLPGENSVLVWGVKWNGGINTQVVSPDGSWNGKNIVEKVPPLPNEYWIVRRNGIVYIPQKTKRNAESQI